MAWALRAFAVLSFVCAACCSGRAETVPLPSGLVDVIEAPGLRQGPTTYRPSLLTGLIFDSNIFSQPKATADTIHYTAAGLVIDTRTSRFVMTSTFSALRLDYLRSTDDSYTDLLGTTLLTYKAAPRLELDVSAGLSRQHEQRIGTNLELPAALGQPVPRTAFTSGLAARFDLNPVKSEWTYTRTAADYDDVKATDGTQIDQDARDRLTQVYSHTATYVRTPRLRFYNTLTANDTRFTNVPAGDLKRDSVKYIAAYGTVFALTPLIDVELIASFDKEEFKSSDIVGKPGHAYTAKVTWLPRTYWRLRAEVSQTAQGVNLQTASSSSEGWLIDLKSDYTLTPRSILRLGYLHSHLDAQSITGPRTDDVDRYYISIGHQINTYTQVGVSHVKEKWRSTNSALSFERDLTQFTLGMKF